MKGFQRLDQIFPSTGTVFGRFQARLFERFRQLRSSQESLLLAKPPVYGTF